MIQCPRDHRPLVEVRQDRQHRCSACRGNLVISPKLREVVKQKFHEVKTTKRLQCPNCKFKMKHYRFQTRHLDIDGCPNCNIFWFDHGEMKAINEYISRYHKQSKRSIGTGLKQFQSDEQKFYAEYMAHQGFEGDLSLDKVMVQVFLGLPVEHNLPPFRKPIITYGIIAINILIAVLSLRYFGQWNYRPLGFKPADPHLHHAMASMFLHASFMHIFGNLYILKMLGDNVEDLMGRLGYLLMYLGSGLGGWLAALMFCQTPQNIHIGASGAVAGVMGAYFYLFPKMKFSFRLFYFFNFNVTSKTIAVLYVLQQFVIKASGVPIAWDAHLGGFIVGLLIAIYVKKAHLI